MNPSLPPQPSLQGMQDILPPPPVPLRPATPAWAALGVVVLALVLWMTWRGVRRWRRNAYRRAALRELAAGGDPPALVKRAALAAWPRAAVAGLAGRDWAGFLCRTGPIVAEDAALLAAFSCLEPGQAALARPRAADAARRWIAGHAGPR